MKKYDYLIVGAGLFGSTYAHCAAKAGKRCLVIDKRPHIGGNVYCQNIEGINVHKYGAHIFHTNNKRVWDFVNGLAPFNRFTNSPLANYKGKLFNLPFNMNTFHQMWGVKTPEEAKEKIEEQRAQVLKILHARGDAEPRNLEEQALSLVGTDIYEKLIKGYTQKQWGRKCSELPSFIIRRLPIRFVYDNNYFSDSFQGIPIGGYNILIEKMLAHAEVRLGSDFFSNRQYWLQQSDKVVFTGRIDEFFDYKFGKLEYRSVNFKTEIIDSPNYQGNAVINYTAESVPYTRIIEHKHFEMFADDVYKVPRTVISKEYSIENTDGVDPYYPINDTRNNGLYAKYKELSEDKASIGIIFGGRLAEYKYYDMAPIVEKVLNIWAP